MCLPVSQTHPTKIVFAMITLHMITTTIFFNADVTFRALWKRMYCNWILDIMILWYNLVINIVISYKFCKNLHLLCVLIYNLLFRCHQRILLASVWSFHNLSEHDSYLHTGSYKNTQLLLFYTLPRSNIHTYQQECNIWKVMCNLPKRCFAWITNSALMDTFISFDHVFTILPWTEP